MGQATHRQLSTKIFAHAAILKLLPWVVKEIHYSLILNRNYYSYVNVMFRIFCTELKIASAPQTTELKYEEPKDFKVNTFVTQALSTCL